MGVMGPRGLFAFVAIVMLTTGLFAVWRMRARPAVPLEEQGAFQPSPSTSPIAVELDPRTDMDETDAGAGGEGRASFTS